MNTFQLKCFLYVADNLSFARTAEQLHISQPAVSGQIQSLEKELNVKLFNRSTRYVRLTPEGRLFISDAKRIVELSENAAKRLESLGKEDLPRLSVGCFSYSQFFLLIPVFRKLFEAFPRLHPRFEVIPFQHLYHLLEEDSLDAIISYSMVSRKRPSHSNVIYMEAAKVPLVCASLMGSVYAEKESIDIEDLKDEKIILLEPTRMQGEYTAIQGRLIEGKAPSMLFFAQSYEMALAMVESGIGVSVMPKLFIPKESDIVCRPIEGCEPFSFGIYYKSDTDNAALKLLISLMKEMKL